MTDSLNSYSPSASTTSDSATMIANVACNGGGGDNILDKPSDCISSSSSSRPSTDSIDTLHNEQTEELISILVADIREFSSFLHEMFDRLDKLSEEVGASSRQARMEVALMIEKRKNLKTTGNGMKFGKDWDFFSRFIGKILFSNFSWHN